MTALSARISATSILGSKHGCSSARLIKDLSPRVHITPTHTEKSTGFPSAPVSRSKSSSSCITSTLEALHHTCHPWLRHFLPPALDSSLEDSNHLRDGTLP